MQGVGTEVGRLARPAGASCCALTMPGAGRIYGGLVPVASILSSGVLARCFVHLFWATKGMRMCFSTFARNEIVT